MAVARWTLEEARSHLPELIARAATEPQRIVAEGREAAIVLSLAEFERLSGGPGSLKGVEPTGAEIVAAFSRCPCDFDFAREAMPGVLREPVI